MKKGKKLIYFCRSINHGGEPEDDEDPDRGDDINVNRPQRDELREELLIGGGNNAGNNLGDPEAPVRTWCFNLVRLRQNGNYDFFCLRNVKKG